MFLVGLTRVVLPLVGLLQFPLREIGIVGLDVDLLVGRLPRNDGHRLVRRIDSCNVIIVCSLLPSSSGDQPSLELVRSGHSRDIAYCGGVAVEGIDQILLVAELVSGFRDFDSRFVDESTNLLDFSTLSRHR